MNLLEFKAMNLKAKKHTKIYTDSLKIELHPVTSNTKMIFTISKESKNFIQKIAQEQLLNPTRTTNTH